MDARRGIPRKANEQHLPPYQAFWVWTTDVSSAVFYLLLGIAGASLILIAGHFLEVRGTYWLILWTFAVVALACAFLDAYLLCHPYHLWTMSTSHGSARWAKLKDLIQKGLVNRIGNLPVPKTALPLAKVFGGRDLYLPKEQWLRHFVIFGPTGSGKSKTFFMWMLRQLARSASCLAYDPKAELCAQTGKSFRQIFQLNLNEPEKSDRWNFLPLCVENPSFACQIAGMMLGLEARQKTTQDPFWGNAEQLALTAILLHLAAVYGMRAAPPMAADFLIGVGDNENSFGAILTDSPSVFARQAYLAYRKAPHQTQGSILIGLYNKLQAFTQPAARQVTAMPTAEERANGCRIIDFKLLRKPGTGIFLVCSEGAADMYKEFIATFLGQAVMEMRLDGANDPKHPCFVLIDEAYQLNVAEVKRISGIGRGRGVGLGLGYQDLSQMYDQYGKEQAEAILETIMTKVFLPGLQGVTAKYASDLLGETTVYSKTLQDFVGTKNDNTRYAEQKRELMNPNEIRQIAAHKQLLIVTDTAPPVRAAYPPLAEYKALTNSEKIYVSPIYGDAPPAVYLSDIDSSFAIQQSESTEQAASEVEKPASLKAVENNEQQNDLTEAVNKIVDETFDGRFAKFVVETSSSKQGNATDYDIVTAFENYKTESNKSASTDENEQFATANQISKIIPIQPVTAANNESNAVEKRATTNGQDHLRDLPQAVRGQAEVHYSQHYFA